MPFKNAVLVLLFCSVFQTAVSTGILLNVLKNTVQKTRCKLHNIGSNIIHHSHHHGDPCGPQDRDNGQYDGQGNNQFGYQNGYKVPEDDQNSYQYGAISECSQNTDCALNEACIRYKCVDPCPGTCGINAECKVRYHVPSCSCIPGSTGDAYIQCYSNIRPAEIISQCIFNKHCPLNQACLQSKCVDPCPGICGINAKCKVVDHSPFCSCITGHTGDPFLQCYAIAASNQQHENGSSNGQNSGNFGQQGSVEISGTGDYIKALNERRNQTNVNSITKKPSIENNSDDSVSNQENSRYTNTPEVSSENYPSSVDIDIRSGFKRVSQNYKTTTYANVPHDGGRNIFKANCPKGKIATNNGECLDEF